MDSDVYLGFNHRYIAGEGNLSGLTLLLLHGTGGDGDSLLQLGYTIAPGATLLSPTGRVLEGESRRFFRRLREGVFDQEDLALRTRELGDFVRDAAVAYQLERHRIVAVGYSNGANIASSLMLRQPDVLAGAVLFRPMVPFTPEPAELLSGIPVLICAGERDPLLPPGDTERLAAIFRADDADVTVHVERSGHELAMGDVVAARDWLARNFTPSS
ncbi:MAG TPA: alpha/beta hydrolase [Gemmatimonadaceae bacterium]|jgi:predicted esterase